MSLVFSEVAEIALVAARLGQFQKLLKTHVILILNFTRTHAITFPNLVQLIVNGSPSATHSACLAAIVDVRLALLPKLLTGS